jgi:hypothetical protein
VTVLLTIALASDIVCALYLALWVLFKMLGG